MEKGRVWTVVWRKGAVLGRGGFKRDVKRLAVDLHASPHARSHDVCQIGLTVRENTRMYVK